MKIKNMETSSTVFKALDALTIMTAHQDGIALPDLAQALNQPRTNVVRIVRTLQSYGFVSCDGRRWTATAAFRTWSAAADRHAQFVRRYQPVLNVLSSASGELVMLGLHEGNGILHIASVESGHRQCRAPVAEIRHSLRYNVLGKLALSRRPDLALKFSDLGFQQELEEIRRNGVAWTQDSARGTISMAIPGFVNLPTEPMLALTWPVSHFTEAGAAHIRHVAREAMEAGARENPSEEKFWSADAMPNHFRTVSVA